LHLPYKEESNIEKGRMEREEGALPGAKGIIR